MLVVRLYWPGEPRVKVSASLCCGAEVVGTSDPALPHALSIVSWIKIHFTVMTDDDSG